MGSGGEQSQQRRRVRPTSEGGTEPIVIQTNGPMGKTDGFLIDDGEPPRQRTSVIRLEVPPVPKTRTVGSNSTTSHVPLRRQQGMTKSFPRSTVPMPPAPREAGKAHAKVHWLLPLGVTVISLVVLWVLGSALLAWGLQFYDGILYGYPRTSQVDMVVGHDDSVKNPSHFIALNLNRQIVVIELRGSDPGKAVTYLAPLYVAGDNGDLAPVTLEFRDVTGDGKLDMLVHIHIAGQDRVYVFINDGTKFRSPNSTDKIMSYESSPTFTKVGDDS